jgi:uncharacterized protein YkwD
MNRSLFCSLLLVVLGVGEGMAADAPVIRFPEPNPPCYTNSAAASVPPPTLGLAASGPVLYSIGDPTDDEQLYLELINRARANPAAEGWRLAHLTEPGVVSALNQFSVDLQVMTNEFNALPVGQPLSFNSILIGTARAHSDLMFAQQSQQHQLAGEQSPGNRISAAGYNFANLGENIFAFSSGTLFGHAGFQIDWGSDSGGSSAGMQSARGHRAAIHNTAFREVGVGIKNGTSGPVGPQLVTEDFGVRTGATPLITGVVYHDLNSNQFYDVGEGLGGVVVEVSGASFYAITAASGGYTVPVAGNGNYTVTFTAANGGSFTTNVTVAGGLNLKVDWRPVFQAPVLSGPTKPINGFAMNYAFTTPVGITNYAWQVLALSPVTFSDTADVGLVNFNVTTTAGYSVTGADTNVVRSSVFHLVHPEAEIQVLELKNKFIPKPGAALSFVSRLAFATTNQVPRVQVSQDNGSSWTDVWAQTGGSESSSGAYQSVNVSLGGLARIETKLRFIYAYEFHDTGSYYTDTSYFVGWFFDNISLTGVDSGAVAGSSTVNGAAQFAFSAGASGNYLVFLKAAVPNRSYPVGNVLEFQSVAAPSVQIVSPVAPAVGSKRFDVNLSQPADVGLQVQSATSINGVWSVEPGVTSQTLSAQQSFRLTLPTFTGNRFYRVMLVPQ